MKKQPDFTLALVAYFCAGLIILYATLGPLDTMRVIAVMGAAGWWLVGVGFHAKSHKVL